MSVRPESGRVNAGAPGAQKERGKPHANRPVSWRAGITETRGKGSGPSINSMERARAVKVQTEKKVEQKEADTLM